MKCLKLLKELLETIADDTKMYAILSLLAAGAVRLRSEVCRSIQRSKWCFHSVLDTNLSLINATMAGIDIQRPLPLAGAVSFPAASFIEIFADILTLNAHIVYPKSKSSQSGH